MVFSTSLLGYKFAIAHFKSAKWDITMQMKERFLNAVISGKIGKQDELGVTVTLKEFKKYFSDMNTGYINSFLPAAVIETGQYTITNTKYVFRLKSGIYHVHPKAIAEQIKLNEQKSDDIEEMRSHCSHYIVYRY